jgi:hypothetical protein
MPKALERYLKKEAMKHHLHGDRMNAYIYSTLNKIEKARKKKYGGKYA